MQGGPSEPFFGGGCAQGDLQSMIAVNILACAKMASQLKADLPSSMPGIGSNNAPVNIFRMHGRAPSGFAAIYLESNVHCVYCHNACSDEAVDPEDFLAFLWTSSRIFGPVQTAVQIPDQRHFGASPDARQHSLRSSMRTFSINRLEHQHD